MTGTLPRTAPAPGPRPRRRGAGAVLTLAALVAAAGAGVVAVTWDRGLVPALFERCTAQSEGRTVSLSPDQATNAATIAAVGVARGLPARAVTIALATAYQESDLVNVSHGDRDSLGLFQQRPSQGWGTAEQVQDPRYAAGRFYDALVTVPGYTELEVTAAAQAVQRSAFPAAYADHADDARVLASALTGNSPAAFACSLRPGSYDAQAEGAQGLTPRASTVRDELTATWGELPIGGFAPGGVSTGHVAGSAHYDGRALDVFFRPVGDAEQRRRGWVTAHWLVANADRLGIATVIFDDRIWTARRSAQGWRAYVHPSGASAANDGDPVLRHLDHVHVDVARGS